jgi:cation:H+ antiporter
MSESFIGTLMVAAVTSLPELTVTIAAVRMGSVDIAVGNLLGSNMFNMLFLAIGDLLFFKGPLLAHVNTDHALSGLVALLMTSIVGAGILYSTPRKRFVLGIDAVLIIVLYIFLMLVLYNMR